MLLKLFLFIFVSAAALVLAEEGAKQIVHHFDAVKVDAETSAEIVTGLGSFAEKIAAYWKHKPLTKSEDILVENANALQATIDLILANGDKLSDEDQTSLCNAYQDALKAEQKMLNAIIAKGTVLQAIPNRLTLLFDLKEIWRKIGQVTAAVVTKTKKCEKDVHTTEEATDKLMLEAIGALVGRHTGRLDK